MPAKPALKERSAVRTCAGKKVRNRLLLSAPESEYLAIRPYLEFVPLPGHRCSLTNRISAVDFSLFSQ